MATGVTAHLTALAAVLRYRPDQPRDDHGRWSDTGASGNEPVRETSLDPTHAQRVLQQLHHAGIDSALDAASPEFREAYQQIMAKQPAAQQELQGIVDKAVAATLHSHVDATSAELSNGLGPLKKGERIIEKAAREEGGNLALIRDTVRGQIVVKHIEDVPSAITALKRSTTVVREKNRFGIAMAGVPAEPVSPTGYRDYLANVQLSNGLIGEVQIHVKSMLAAKVTGGGHELYKEIRTLPKTSEGDRRLNHLMEQSRHLYNAAWRDVGGVL